jgi:hypothetical protein
MGNEHLATYLNDHLAGSVVAIELLEKLEDTHKGTPLENFLKNLQKEIEADQQELRTLMDRLDISESKTRKATAWISEKVTELKLHFDDSAEGAFRLFEGLEVLSLGIEGKRALWLVLAFLTDEVPSLRLINYQRLIERAENQRNQVEARRMEIAKKALT